MLNVQEEMKDNKAYTKESKEVGDEKWTLKRFSIKVEQTKMIKRLLKLYKDLDIKE